VSGERVPADLDALVLGYGRSNGIGGGATALTSTGQ
jgi:hypothetical protein